jgi:hypothetical protein
MNLAAIIWKSRVLPSARRWFDIVPCSTPWPAPPAYAFLNAAAPDRPFHHGAATGLPRFCQIAVLEYAAIIAS